jgi:hypothetical protein
MREALVSHVGKRAAFRAIIARSQPGRGHAILLYDITYNDQDVAGNLKIDHVWCQKDGWPQTLEIGDIVKLPPPSGHTHGVSAKLISASIKFATLK